MGRQLAAACPTQSAERLKLASKARRSGARSSDTIVVQSEVNSATDHVPCDTTYPLVRSSLETSQHLGQQSSFHSVRAIRIEM
eukprot:gene9472-11619_t